MLVIKPHRFIDARTGVETIKWEVWDGKTLLATFALKPDAEEYKARRESPAT